MDPAGTSRSACRDGSAALQGISFLPMKRDLSVRSRPRDGVTVVEFNGPVENATFDVFDEGLSSAVKSSPAVVVDLSGVDLITSQGLGLLIKNAEAIGGPDRFVLAALQPRVRDVFQALGLDQFFVITDTVDRALRLLSDLPAAESER